MALGSGFAFYLSCPSELGFHQAPGKLPISKESHRGLVLPLAYSPAANFPFPLAPITTRCVAVGFYNCVRLHSKLGNLPPNAFEQQLATQQPIDMSGKT